MSSSGIEAGGKKLTTIKDVAKKAQVSQGTVSNVLNGKTQNEDLIQRVETAMKELNYVPDATARSLKNTKTNIVGLVLPDVFKKLNAAFLQNIETVFQENGYQVLVRFSHNNELLEKKAIEGLLRQRVDAIILKSTLPQKRSKMISGSKTPIIMVSRYDVQSFSGDNIVIDYRMAFRQLFQEMKQNNLREIGLIMERDCLENGGIRTIYEEFFSDDSLIRIADGSSETGFQAAFDLEEKCPDLQAIIVSSHECGQGVLEAYKKLKKNNVSMYVIKESCWLEDGEYYSGIIHVPVMDVVRETVNRTMEAIEFPHTHENVTKVVSAQYMPVLKKEESIKKCRSNLRFAMYDSSSARSLKLLSQIYEKESGINIKFDLFAYNDLEPMLYTKAKDKDDYYDGFMIDVTWLEGLVKCGGIKNIDHLLQENEVYFKGFLDDAVQDYSISDGSLYSVPFMSGSQILFYQKDLFEDRDLQMRYQRIYNEKLEPPKNWRQFNSVAEFFTKKTNPNSPVEYGVSMERGVNVFTTISFLNRLWFYGGNVFDSLNKVSINSSNAINALNNLKQSYQYTSGQNITSWDKCAKEFESGKTAMVILYNSDMGDINNYTKSLVAGNIGYALIPGEVSVMGGWSLGLNSYGKHQKEAENFLLWACSSINAQMLPILGGSTLRNYYYEQTANDILQPWKNLIVESRKKSRKRILPKSTGNKQIDRIYTYIIPKEICKMIDGEITAEQALINMEQEIQKFMV